MSDPIVVMDLGTINNAFNTSWLIFRRVGPGDPPPSSKGLPPLGSKGAPQTITHISNFLSSPLPPHYGDYPKPPSDHFWSVAADAQFSMPAS